ncbi:MAG: hypothetical protein J5564_05705 [Clostridia bacterium]|nr:hypothetical protein [Clostridia bacterium]
MKEASANSKARKQTILKLIALSAAILVCIFVLRPIFVRESTYREASSYLDGKMATASALTVGATTASLVVSMIPDDTGSAIAEQLAEFSSYLLIVVSAIFLERFLMTSLGFVSTALILPAAFLFWIAAILCDQEKRFRFKEYAFRLLIFGVCLILIIPIGCTIGKGIEDANAYSIQQALNASEQMEEAVESLPEDSKDKNVFDHIGDFFSGLWKNATGAYEWAKTTLNNFMRSVAVMLVTTIVIPILIALCFLWAVKFLTKRDFVMAVVGYSDRFASKTYHALRPGKRKEAKKLKAGK